MNTVGTESFEYPVSAFLQIALVLNKAVGKRCQRDPLLSASAYSYGISVPSWDWDEIGRQVEEVESELDSLPPGRRPFLQDLLEAFALMVREGQGEQIPYAERVATYLQVPPDRVPLETIQVLEDELRELMGEAGYPTDLAVAIPQWRKSQAVPREALNEQGQAIMERARARTEERVTSLPSAHQVALTFPSPYPHISGGGYSDYAGDYQGYVYLSGDISWELPNLKHVVCHETFPGHQAFSAVREQRYRDGSLPVEGTLYFSNTAISPIVEGLAEIGTEILGMLETLDDRINNVYQRLQRAISTNLCFDCNADGMEKETAVREFVESGHVSREFAEQRYRFWTHPLWCTSFPHYWYGREFMHENYVMMKDAPQAFFRMVYGEPHTVRTLRSAIEAHLGQG